MNRKMGALCASLVALILVMLPFGAFAGQFTIPLAQGWNLVSVPGDPWDYDSSIGHVLDPISNKVGTVWSYDNAAKKWLKYQRGAQGNTLGYISPGPGYWIYMTAPDTLTYLTYSDPTTFSASLSSGWNLMGYTWPDSTDLTKTFGNFGGKWKFVWGWEGGTWQVRTASGVPALTGFQELTSLRQTRAYWIYLWPGQSSVDWRPDTSAPGLGLLTPTPGAARVAISTTVSAEFVETLDPASVNASTFLLKDGQLNPVAGTVSLLPGNKVQFTPSANLAYLTTYTATLPQGGIRDLSQNALAFPVEWSFTTRSSDFTPPAVQGTSPPSNGTGVDVTSHMVVTFSENMDCNTITTDTFTVKTKAGDVPVAGSVACLNDTATFTPSSNLAYNTTYTATVTAGATDLAGNALSSAPYLWDFTTQLPPNQSAAGIWGGTFISPSYGVSGVIGMVGGNNQGRFITASGAQYVSDAPCTITGSNYSCAVSAFAPGSLVFPNGQPFGSVTLTGTVLTRTSISGSYSGVGDSGTISVTYDPIYERGSSLAKAAGTWYASLSSVGFPVGVTINGAGALTGSIYYNGNPVCQLSGLVTAPAPSANIYGVSVTVSGCPPPYTNYNGAYSGQAIIVDFGGGTDNTCVMGVSRTSPTPASVAAQFTKQ
jgi:hypothetical protein